MINVKNWDQPEFQPILLNGKNLEVVKSAKLLGVTITSNLLWNDHINDIVKKASKRLYFLVQLKRAKRPLKDLVLFCTTCIRSVVTYAIRVFFYALSKYLQCELDRVQKRAFSIISPGVLTSRHWKKLVFRPLFTTVNQCVIKSSTLLLATKTISSWNYSLPQITFHTT